MIRIYHGPMDEYSIDSNVEKFVLSFLGVTVHSVHSQRAQQQSTAMECHLPSVSDSIPEDPTDGPAS
jgi:hypothetical protein